MRKASVIAAGTQRSSATPTGTACVRLFGPLLVALTLAGCSGGAATLTEPAVPAPAADLDTARPPPQTVTSSPLLPPVPDEASGQRTGGTVAAAPSPMQYEHLYSEDEQAQISAELAAAAARAQRN